MIDSPSYLLTENLRNTKNIYDWAKARTSLGETSFSNQIDGPEPLNISLHTVNQIKKYIIQSISSLVTRDGVPYEYINIIIDDDIFDKIKFETDELNTRNELVSINEEYIGLFKTSEFKGMESNIVYYIHKKNTDYNYKYVGLTRARFFLYDIELNED